MIEAVLEVRYGRPAWQRALPMLVAVVMFPTSCMNAIDEHPVRVGLYRDGPSILFEGVQAAIYWGLGAGIMFGLAILCAYLALRYRSIVLTTEQLVMPGVVVRRGRSLKLTEVVAIGTYEFKKDEILCVSNGREKPVLVRRSWMEGEGDFAKFCEELKNRVARNAA